MGTPSAPSKVCCKLELAVTTVCSNYACSRSCFLDCLAKNSYKEEKCKAHVDALYACCNIFYEQHGEDAKTMSCPKASLLRLKLKQRAQGI